MAEKIDKTALQRGNRYKGRQAERKMTRVSVWVPEDRREDLIAVAEGYRNGKLSTE